MITPLAARRGLITSLARGIQRVDASWWLSGGISAANCVAAYQPKGAASYAASLADLSGTGNNAVEGVAPDWDETNGWIFNGTNDYLDTGINVPTNQEWSMIARFTGGSTNSNRAVCGSNDTGLPNGKFYLLTSLSSGRYYGNGGYKNKSGAVASGVMAVAGSAGYLDGSPDVSGIAAWSAGTNRPNVIIGGLKTETGFLFYFDGEVQAFAIYNAIITSEQVSALTTAIAAL